MYRCTGMYNDNIECTAKFIGVSLITGMEGLDWTGMEWNDTE